MRRSIAVVGLLVLVLVVFGGSRADAQKTDDIEGVWRMVERTTTRPDGRSHTTTPQAALSILTKGYYSFVFDLAPDIRPDLPQAFHEATGDEFRAMLRGFQAAIGTYELSGGQATFRAEVSLFPGGMAPDVFNVFSYELDGDTLSLTGIRSPDWTLYQPANLQIDSGEVTR